MSGGGANGALMRRHDWAATPLGDPASWPQALRSAVSIMLNSRYPIALYWGPELALLYNDDWTPIPGGKHPWALGRPGREVWPEIWNTIGPLFAQVMATGEGVWQQDELLPMIRHGYLEECYYNFTFSPVRGEDGAIDGIFNAVVETTDRVLSERRLRTLSRMGQRSDPSLSVDAACAWVTEILTENRADVPFAQVYRQDGDELHLAAGGPALTEAAWPFEDAMRAGHAVVVPVPTEYGLQSAFWSEPITEAVIVPITMAGEERPAAFLLAGANPRRRVDASYRSFFELAAGHAGTAIATARAYEDERRRAQALAEIDRAKTAFFSNVSHEFRTPLTLMLGPLEDAIAAAAAPEQRERLDLAHRNALRLLRLVNALLDFSRIEAGRVEATFRPTDLAALTAELASSFRSATDRAGLRLVLETPALSQPVFVDRGMWETIVLNLVSNAFKFTLAGEITISLHEVADRAMLTVRDTGSGIPAAELPRLFDRFHRVEGARSRSFEGSGIGLALVHELVRLHGGTIEVASKEGSGTTVAVALPFGTAHLPADHVRKDAGAAEHRGRAQMYVEEATRWLPEDGRVDPPQSSTGPRSRVVVADDNADLRDYIARLLTESGYDVTAVADGRAALAAVGQCRPDLLITDVMMPELDGVGLLRALREQDGLRDLPVIMLSARAGEESKLEGLDAGADDYLTKPFSARELIARVAANIKLATLRQAAAEAVRASEARLRELNATLEQRVAEALAERRLFADIFEATDASVQVLDRSYRFLAINASAQGDYRRVFGVEAKAGLCLLDLLADAPDQQRAARAVWGRVLGGEAFSEISWWGAPGHDRRAFDIRFSPLFGPGGDQIGAYLIAQDITERLREQERLAAAEEQLRQGQKMEAMGQLTGGVAHDFNNLLTPIVGALDILRSRGVGGEREQRLIAGAAQSAERAKTLVQRLLAFARRQPLRTQAVDIAALVQGMADLITTTTGPTIRVVVDCAPGLAPATADPNQLEMALLNLAVNARDAMPEGGTLRIGVAEERLEEGAQGALPAGRYVRLTVADSGTGMDEAVLARAVEPFFSTKGVGKGTGLGLSMVHGLASQLGGTLDIQSRPGQGTTIQLWLPVCDEAAPGGTAPEPALAPAGASGTALLVDDEDLARASTADMLGELGYVVVEAASAEEALQRLRSGFAPNLVVTDHLMPGMSGTELARVVGAERPGLKVLLISGYAAPDGMPSDVPRLSKPFRTAELAASLAGLPAG